jgi:hypothetical protein
MGTAQRNSKSLFLWVHCEVRVSTMSWELHRRVPLFLVAFSWLHCSKRSKRMLPFCYPFVTLFVLQDHGGALKQLRWRSLMCKQVYVREWCFYELLSSVVLLLQPSLQIRAISGSVLGVSNVERVFASLFHCSYVCVKILNYSVRVYTQIFEDAWRNENINLRIFNPNTK